MSTTGFPDPRVSFRRRVVIPPASPVVLSVPHAGVAVTGFEGSLSSSLDVRADADLYVDRLYGVGAPIEGDELRAAELLGGGAGPQVPYVAALLSRFVCDMNRDPDDVSLAAVPEHPAPKNADGRGFVWAVTTTGASALARPLTMEEWQARQAVHRAYHQAITEGLERARDRFGFAILVDGHSMPSVGRTGHKDPGRARAEIVPGDRDGTSCAPSLSRAVNSHFKTAGYRVSFNDPYKGGFITAHHGRPFDGIHAIQIEARRDLYMDEPTFTPRRDGFAKLHDTLAALLDVLHRWRP